MIFVLTTEPLYFAIVPSRGRIMACFHVLLHSNTIFWHPHPKHAKGYENESKTDCEHACSQSQNPENTDKIGDNTADFF